MMIHKAIIAALTVAAGLSAACFLVSMSWPVEAWWHSWEVEVTGGSVLVGYFDAGEGLAFERNLGARRHAPAHLWHPVPRYCDFRTPGGRGRRHVLIPFWIPFALGTAGWLVLRRRWRRHPPGHCTKCGYDLTANVSGVCPECGTKVEQA